MRIDELSRPECLEVLAEARLARLACSHENQPYIVPVFVAFHESPDGGACLYGFTTRGQKVEWMRTNPLVCVEVDDVAAIDQWVSVIIFGRYEELPAPFQTDGQRLLAASVLQIGRHGAHHGGKTHDPRLLAHDILQSHAAWWEPGSSAFAARQDRDRKEPFVPLYYRVWIDRVTGHRASPGL